MISLLERGEIPVAMTLRTNERERAVYKGVGGGAWYVRQRLETGAHRRGGAWRSGTCRDLYALPVIAAHFARFMSPDNMLGFPAEFSGLTEVPAFIEGYCSAKSD